jgi:hypothetical protein
MCHEGARAGSCHREAAGEADVCLFASAYIVIDVSGRWPTEADLREIASHAAQAVTRLDITEQEIYEYLAWGRARPGKAR